MTTIETLKKRVPRLKRWGLILLGAGLASAGLLGGVAVLDEARDRTVEARRMADYHANATPPLPSEPEMTKEEVLRRYGPEERLQLVGGSEQIWNRLRNSREIQKRRLEYHKAMRLKWERLAAQPWLMREPDPPEPR